MNQFVIDKIKTAPKDPGVYIFYKGEKVLYVGKAANLRARLKSYLKITDIKTQSLHEEADRLEHLLLRSDIEALIEEAKLIKSLKPKYNVVLRDDKSYCYVGITKEDFPRVFVTHKNKKVKELKLKMEMIGPFTDGWAVRVVLKLLRRQFPYCTCAQKHLRDCLNAQIGKCIGVCCLKNQSPVIASEAKQSYKKMIRKIKMVLTGQSKKLLKTIKDQRERDALKSIFEHRPYIEAKKNVKADLTEFPVGYKVECYDNSNFAGKEAVGALTGLIKTETGWQSNKGDYRKFIIKSTPTQDDPRMIGELISRRLNHPEWPYPDLIIIDGGITQFRAAKRAWEHFPAATNVKIISFAKPHKMVYGLRAVDIPTPLLELSKELREVIERAVYQTHNFVIRFHRDKRSKLFIPRD